MKDLTRADLDRMRQNAKDALNADTDLPFTVELIEVFPDRWQVKIGDAA